MAETTKNIKSRIINKHDLEINWEKATAFIPLKGEIIIYDREILVDGSVIPNAVTDQDGNSLLASGRTAPFTYERFKIGDGTTQDDGTVVGTNVNDLPFFDNQLQQWINILAASVNNDMSIIYPKLDELFNSLGFPNEGQSNAWAYINYILSSMGSPDGNPTTTGSNNAWAWIGANRDLILSLQNQIGDVESLLAEL